MSRVLRCAALSLCTICLGCAGPVQQTPTPTLPAPALPTPACTPVKRAGRMYTGFAVDVPGDRMYVALDVIRPLEARLTELFCAPALDGCRPAHLLTIMLSDAVPSEARVTLEGGPNQAGQTLELVLVNVAERWQPVPESLAALVAPCQSASASPTAR